MSDSIKKNPAPPLPTSDNQALENLQLDVEVQNLLQDSFLPRVNQAFDATYGRIILNETRHEPERLELASDRE